MKTRQKGYARDYHLTKDDIETVKEFCRNACTEQELLCLQWAAEESNQSLSSSLILSVQERMSYEQLGGDYSMHCTKQDFYGYRRKFISNLHSIGRLLGYIK